MSYPTTMLHPLGQNVNRFFCEFCASIKIRAKSAKTR